MPALLPEWMVAAFPGRRDESGVHTKWLVSIGYFRSKPGGLRAVITHQPRRLRCRLLVESRLSIRVTHDLESEQTTEADPADRGAGAIARMASA